MERRTIRIGTRASDLARWQANHVRSSLEAHFPNHRFEQVLISTTGDRLREAPLPTFGAVGVFTKEIESALLGDEIDLAVHSLKDLPTTRTEGLEIGAVLEREDPRDAFLSRSVRSFSELPRGARVATSSLRRQAQLLHGRPDLEIVAVRGNVPTRVRKLDEGQFDGIILACAGLVRIGLSARITETFGTDFMLPAPGQGAIAVETRKGDPFIGEIVRAIHDEATARCVSSERAVLRTLRGGCHVPVGALGTISEGSLTLDALVASPDGRRYVRRSITGSAEQPESLGVRLGEELIEAGARTIIEDLRWAEER